MRTANGSQWESSVLHAGSPSISRRQVAFRPHLAMGLAFSVLKNKIDPERCPVEK
jgi:hypothetical protein